MHSAMIRVLLLRPDIEFTSGYTIVDTRN